MANKGYSRVRADTGQHRRILVVGLLFGLLAFLPVIWRLYQLMVTDFSYYSGLALRNQTRTTGVTPERGIIYDRNMDILACSQSVENVFLDPHELKQSGADLQAIGKVLGTILELEPSWIEEQGKDLKKRYKKIAANIDERIVLNILKFLKSLQR